MKYGPTIFATDDVTPAPDLAREAGDDTSLPMLGTRAAFVAEVG